ncbi:Sec-independent protein translocase protein TatAd [Anaerolineae bacterium]|nr:Sec-independent protein translocase protein TatAd [Anaerolineae bacterium]
MFGLQPLHILFIIVIALLIFGPSRFAGLGRGFGKMFSEFRSASKDTPENSENNSSKKSEPPQVG